MARTIIPPYPGRDFRKTIGGLLKFVRKQHEFYQADLDKAGEMDTAYYYQGYVDAMTDIVWFLCKKPKKEN